MENGVENTGWDFKTELKSKVAEIEVLLSEYLPKQADAPSVLVEAMNYSVTAGGKRLRPLLIRETYRMFGGQEKEVEPFMAAMEMIHTYSLVHDDLPAMDNDEYRRGRRTTWAVYGDAMGILVGDGLLNYAFETALKAFEGCKTVEEYDRVHRAIAVLANNAGMYGMIGGQVADIEAEDKPELVTEERLKYIHTHKTGALIEAAMLIGAILGGASKEEQEIVSQCALDIGLAFQIQDDILDVVGNSEELGKPVGSDAANGKQTYVTLKGFDNSVSDVERLSDEAVELLQKLPGDHDFMESLISYLIARRN